MEQKSICVKDLLLDVDNPRFDPVKDQQEAMRSLLMICKTKILNLALDIVKHGVNPSDLMICLKRENDSRVVYVVKEGNRRLLAVKCLLNPELLNNAAWSAKLRRALRESQVDISVFKRLEVLVFDEAEQEALKHWVLIKHNGEGDGSGTVKWGAKEKRRFDQQGQVEDFATYVLNWLSSSDGLSEIQQEQIASAPITTFERIIRSSSGRELLGIYFREGKLCCDRPEQLVRRDLLKIVADLTTASIENPRKKKVNVSNVKNAHQIRTYLQGSVIGQVAPHEDETIEPSVLPQHIGENVTTKNGHPVVVPAISQTLTPSRGPVAKTEKYLCACLKKLQSLRSNPKVPLIAKELSQMPVGQMPLSFCIVFRSLVDISLIAFSRANGIKTDNGKGERKTMKNLADECCSLIKKQMGALNGDSQISALNEALRTLTSEKSMFSITELNQLVHGADQVPSSETIYTYAPRVVPFLIALNGGDLSKV